MLLLLNELLNSLILPVLRFQYGTGQSLSRGKVAENQFDIVHLSSLEGVERFQAWLTINFFIVERDLAPRVRIQSFSLYAFCFWFLLVMLRSRFSLN